MSIVIQIASSSNLIPAENEFTTWAERVLVSEKAEGEVTIRIVDAAEIRQLNREYRHKDKPTNVLAFPFANPEIAELETILGDVVICAEVVAAEARQQQKNLKAHYAHMLVHGVLHLLGYDHIEDAEAGIMQAKEAEILSGINFKNLSC